MSGGPGMQPRFTQSVTVTVRAFPPQAEKWEAAAAIHGYRDVGGWLATIADAAASEVARSGKAPALRWEREYFRVLVTDRSVHPEETYEIQVHGETSCHFGIFRGDSGGIGEPGCCRFSLVHLPTARIIGTLPLCKAVKALAAELAVLNVNWQETDPQKVLQDAPDQKKAQELLRQFRTLTQSVYG